MAEPLDDIRHREQVFSLEAAQAQRLGLEVVVQTAAQRVGPEIPQAQA